MKGVLILAHGSREKKTELTLQAIVDLVRKELKIENMEFAFLQFSQKSLKEGLLSLVNMGINDIILIPYFLFDGVHIREDIPGEIDDFRKEYPDVKVTFGRTLGADPRLAAILADRVRELVQD